MTEIENKPSRRSQTDATGGVERPYATGTTSEKSRHYCPTPSPSCGTRSCSGSPGADLLFVTMAAFPQLFTNKDPPSQTCPRLVRPRPRRPGSGTTARATTLRTPIYGAVLRSWSDLATAFTLTSGCIGSLPDTGGLVRLAAQPNLEIFLAIPC